MMLVSLFAAFALTSATAEERNQNPEDVLARFQDAKATPPSVERTAD